MRTVVRSHEPPLARPREFVRTAWLDLRRSRPLAVELAKRDIRSQYRHPWLGAAAVLLPPLAITAVALGFRRAGILSVDSAAIPYDLFVLLGVILWMTFVDALYAPIYGLAAEQRLLARTSAPPEALVTGKIGPVLFNAGVRTILLAIALAWYGTVPAATLVLAPIGLLGLVALGTAAGVLLAPVNLLYRDIARLLGVATTFWFFVSPVYFPVPAAGAVGTIMRANPVTPLLSGTRALVLIGNADEALLTIAYALGALALLVPAWLFLRVTLPSALEQAND